MMTISHSAPPLRTLHGLLEDRARRWPQRPFLDFGERTYSVGDLGRSASSLAKGLQESGVAQGEHVAVLMANRPEYLFVSFALAKLGAVEVPLNTAHRGMLLSYMLRQSESATLIIEAGFLPQFQEVSAELPGLRRVIVLDGRPPPATGRAVFDFAELLTGGEDYRPAVVRRQDPMAILYTSGTTGPSKGAVLPHNYALNIAEAVCELARYDERDCLFNALPLFHGNAKLLSTLPALMSGARMVLAEKFSAGRFWDEVRHYGCTEFNYIGSILSILLKAEPSARDRDHSIRLMFGAGAPPGICEAFEQRFGVTLLEGYGMSEIGIPVLSRLDARRPGACGLAHPDYELRLVDDEDNEVGADQPGELLVRPKRPWSMLLGYYKMPERTVEAWQGLWFHTGDTLRRDADGYYYFLDRKKDAIRRRGENISSFEVERLLTGHPAVLECAAVPVPSALGEDEVMVCVVRRPGQALDATELLAFCRTVMADFMVPRYVRFVDALPRTPTEKVQKFRLREEGLTADTYDRERAAAGSGGLGS